MRNRRTTRRIWLTLIAGLLLAGGVWWWRQPATLREVARLDGVQPIQACRDGVVVSPISRSYDFGLCDWRTGQLRWCVRLPESARTTLQTKCPPCVSDDGHDAAQVAYDRDKLRLLRWHDGILRQDRTVPAPSRDERGNGDLNTARLATDGRLWCTYRTTDGVGVLSLDRDGRLARGQIDFTAQGIPEPMSLTFAPDGRLLAIADPEYCWSLAVTGDHIASRLVSHAQNVYPGGISVDDAGTVYLPGGQTAQLPGKPQAWYVQRETRVLICTPAQVMVHAGRGWGMERAPGSDAVCVLRRIAGDAGRTVPAA